MTNLELLTRYIQETTYCGWLNAERKARAYLKHLKEEEE